MGVVWMFSVLDGCCVFSLGVVWVSCVCVWGGGWAGVGNIWLYAY